MAYTRYSIILSQRYQGCVYRSIKICFNVFIPTPMFLYSYDLWSSFVGLTSNQSQLRNTSFSKLSPVTRRRLSVKTAPRRKQLFHCLCLLAVLTVTVWQYLPFFAAGICAHLTIVKHQTNYWTSKDNCQIHPQFASGVDGATIILAG